MTRKSKRVEGGIEATDESVVPFGARQESYHFFVMSLESLFEFLFIEVEGSLFIKLNANIRKYANLSVFTGGGQFDKGSAGFCFQPYLGSSFRRAFDMFANFHPSDFGFG